MVKTLKQQFNWNLLNVPGWKTKRKILVIESDDWGTIRMPDEDTFNVLLGKYPKLIRDRMSKFDSLESNDDLISLFETLSSVKDSTGNSAILTANTIVANPDFDAIRAADFKTYHYELFTSTLKRSSGRANVFDLIKQGIDKELYRPQFHGREHVNVEQWLKALQAGHPELVAAFDCGVFGIQLTQKAGMRNNLMSAFDFDDAEEAARKHGIVKEGLDIFENLFGFRSKSFIATTYVWDSGIESALKESGVQYIQGIPRQYIPNPGASSYKTKYHYNGQRNLHHQLYLVRNAFFEPTITPGGDPVGECLKRIELAFKWNNPAILGTHRVNFSGSIHEQNRTGNLKLLKEILDNVVSLWPEVEFMSSDRLGDVIQEKGNK